ncbi:putative DNA-binding transcriptional regulator [Enterobacter sp. Cy-643]|uniref:YfeC-like transcriptional regulator n=1 Tax=Enterobacter sp. Cy-643 TaxID=2608346 RepID=UPI0014239780|nr:YfeC-like transcriptional regulator [Enterobacter sp. Cy-643]NIF30817.1 putative DNA-binding transcriptional regulator [Enterobacter sp. Cy-643]
MFKEKMTTDELAEMTGYTRQTINKWILKHNWETSEKRGVPGGKARFVYISEQVKTFLYNTSKMNEKVASYSVPRTPLEQLMLNALRTLSEEEQHKMTAILEREGSEGLLNRLGIQKNE